MKTPITIIGAGNMGTALAKSLGQHGHVITLWNYAGDPEPLQQINAFHENKKYLPGIILPTSVVAEPDLKTALQSARLVILSVPSSVIERQLEACVPFLPAAAVLVDVSKGFTGLFNKKSTLTSSAEKWWNKRIIISGPAVALDIATGGFTTMAIAGKNKRALAFAKAVLSTARLNFLPTNDILGIKLAGSLKNVYAILLGMADGLGLSLNAKAFLMVRAVEEMSLLVKKSGGDPHTPYSLAGLGDLVATGLSPISRNRRFGEFMGQGLSFREAQQEVGQVVEGIPSSHGARALAKKFHLKLPLLAAVHEVVNHNKTPAMIFESILCTEYLQKKRRVRV